MNQATNSRPTIGLTRNANDDISEQTSHRSNAGVDHRALDHRGRGSVLLGIESKPYHILPWLLHYNILMGFVSLIAGIGLWMENDQVTILATTILVCHGVVFLSLSVMHLLGETVAVNSIMAMLFRTGVWIVVNTMTRRKE